MNCDYCNKPAVVHEVTVKNGEKHEVHLCEEHAAEAGMNMPGSKPINELLTKFVISHPSSSGGAATSGTSPSAKSVRRRCATCGLGLDEFRRTGLLGCPDCYESFRSQLEPLIERAQNGGVSHLGKTPRRAGASIDRQLHRQRLIQELDHAVNAEQYERAAQLRDQLESLETDTPNADENHDRASESSSPKKE